MSALPPKADIHQLERHVRIVPKADSQQSFSIASSTRASRIGGYKPERFGCLQVDEFRDDLAAHLCRSLRRASVDLQGYGGDR